MLSAPKFLIGLEPKEAVDFLHQKKLLASKVFKKELYDSALARATTIARLDSLEMTKDIYASLESAVKNGISFSQWKKDIMAEFERKGWVFAHDKKVSRGIDGKQLADPKTGEYFGTPRRLNTIFRVNTQAAYSAGRYQRLMDNVDNRPYWQYSAVGDNRTRPAHMALHGRIYRYDDPFWATFYPPNGFNCRCTVIALADRDLKRKGIDKPDDSSQNLVEIDRPADKQGNVEKTVGFKLPDGSIRTTDKGFDYNIGRLSYRPNLDLYPEKLAHQFAKVEMIGGEFLHNFKRLKKEIESIKDVNQLNGKLTTEQVVNIRNKLSFNFKFAAGVLSKESKTKINAKTSTVWLSDDTLIKQFNSREGQDFNANEYSDLPDMINTPDYLLPAKDFHDRYMFIKKGKMLVLKVLENELFILSFRKMRNKELEKLLNK
ncbi:phage head morphogenesis protein, SPP1 gp7 family [[Actinobacillus] rossii]|uniref:Phage head morphogenesis protein, SPP1 gp7 family n=1 Tax=[Actinobacillus] rossii TaxID=123820 RepID=A0A380U1P8_9PAST|nr:phage head morphogenesis protein, SPP1 gp7 family [[Actinobacillus] rossii]